MQSKEPSMQRDLAFLSLAAAIASIAIATATDAAIGSAQDGGTGSLSGHVTVRDGSSARDDRSQVIVYVETGQRPTAPASDDRPAIHQADLRFSPDLVVVPRGGVVDFPNDDRVFHNVFSLSRTKRFDLGLYRAGESRSVTFDRAGTVDVYCNIHPDMIAQIFVLDTPHYAVTSRDGGYVIRDLPAGTWSVVARQRYGELHRSQVTIPRGGTATHDLVVDAGERPRSHTRRDGTPYGRYR